VGEIMGKGLGRKPGVRGSGEGHSQDATRLVVAYGGPNGRWGS